MDKNLSLIGPIPKRKWIGRPPKFQDPVKFQQHIDEYFSKRQSDGLPITVTGLAIHLDTSREILLNYENELLAQITEEKDKKSFSDAIKRAKHRCQDFSEMQLYRSVGQVAGTIFALKNNWKWQDRLDIEISGHVSAGQVPGEEREELKFSLNDFYRERREKLRVDR